MRCAVIHIAKFEILSFCSFDKMQSFLVNLMNELNRRLIAFLFSVNEDKKIRTGLVTKEIKSYSWWEVTVGYDIDFHCWRLYLNEKKNPNQ